MSNLENANVKSAEERKRAEMHRTYGIKREQQLPTLFLGVMQE
jgi:hypothetical protein